MGAQHVQGVKLTLLFLFSLFESFVTSFEKGLCSVSVGGYLLLILKLGLNYKS